MPEDIARPVLDSLTIDPSLKRSAWDHFYQASSPEDFKQRFDSLDIPREAKRALWNAKFPQPGATKIAPEPQAELQQSAANSGAAIDPKNPASPRLPSPAEAAQQAQSFAKDYIDSVIARGAPQPAVPPALQGDGSMQGDMSRLMPDVQRGAEERGITRFGSYRDGGTPGQPSLGEMKDVGILLGTMGLGEAAVAAKSPIAKRALAGIVNAAGGYLAYNLGESALEGLKKSAEAFKKGDYLDSIRQLGTAAVAGKFAYEGGKAAVKAGVVLDPTYAEKQANLPPSERDLGSKGARRGPIEPEIVPPEAAAKKPTAALNPETPLIDVMAQEAAPAKTKRSRVEKEAVPLVTKSAEVAPLDTKPPVDIQPSSDTEIQPEPVEKGGAVASPPVEQSSGEAPIAEKSTEKTVIPEKAKKTAPEPGSVVELPVASIKVDPGRFQFKANVGQGGAGEELRKVETFDPEKAGVVLVWHDPADNNTYIVNGHNRLALADRTDTETITSRYVKANNAQEARVKGALVNIAEGRGESTDAAKVFREGGFNEETLKQEGVSITGKVASEGLALSKLDPELFKKVISGDIPAARAAVIGAGLPEHADQRALYDLVQKQDKAGKRPTNDQIEEMIRLATAPVEEGGAPKKTDTQVSLFGEEEITRSLIAEKAEVSDYIRKQLGSEKKLFGLVGKEAVAGKLADKGNVIKTPENQAVATQAAQAMAIYDKLSSRSGPVSDALGAAATDLAEGKDATKAKQVAYLRVRQALVQESNKLAGVPEGSLRRPEGHGGEGPRQTGAGQQDSAEEKAAVSEPRLPALLAGAKPKYNLGLKSFDLNFASDIDKAAYISAQAKRSKSDSSYLKFAMQATGLPEPAVRAHGAAVKQNIKAMAQDAKPGALVVPKQKLAVQRGGAFGSERGSFSTKPTGGSEPSLFSEEDQLRSRKEAESDEARLLGDQLTAQFKSGGQVKALKKAKPAKQTGLFEETPEEPQGDLFGSERGSFSLRPSKPAAPVGPPVTKKQLREIGAASRKYDITATEVSKLASQISKQPDITKLSSAHAAELVALMGAKLPSGNRYYAASIRPWSYLVESPSNVLGRSLYGARIYREGEKQFFEQQRMSRRFVSNYHKVTKGLSQAEKNEIAQYRLRINEKGERVENPPALPAKLEEVNRNLTTFVYEPMFKIGVKKGLVGERQHFDDYLPYYRENTAKFPGTAKADMAANIAQELGIPIAAAEQIMEEAVRNVNFGPFDYSRLAKSVPELRQLDKITEIYVKGFARKVAVSDFLAAANPLRLKIKDDGLRKYARDYIDQYAGKPQYSAADDWLARQQARVPGLRNLNLSGARIAGAATAVQFQAKLGFNLFSPVLNLTQTLVNTVPAFGAIRTFKVLPKGAAAVLLPNSLNPFVKELARLNRSGVLDSQSVKFEQTHFSGYWGKAQDAMSYLFNKSEQLNRSTAFLAGYEQAKSKGLGEAAAIAKGREAVRTTQFFSGRLDGPLFSRTPVGRVMMQFKIFTAKEIEFVTKLDRTQKIKFAAMSAALGGVAALGLLQAFRAFAPDSDVTQMLEEWQETYNVAAFLQADHLAKQFGIYNVPGLETFGNRDTKETLLEWAAGPTLNAILDLATAATKDRDRATKMVTAAVRGFVPGGAELLRIKRAMEQATTPEEALRILTSMQSAQSAKPASGSSDLLGAPGRGGRDGELDRLLGR